MGTKYSQRPQFQQGPTWEDVQLALVATEDEFAVRTRITLTPIQDGKWDITIRAWRNDMGAPIGLAVQQITFPHAAHKTIEGAAFRLACRIHEDVYKGFYDTPYTHGIKGPGR